jgi:hypothetical protein
MLISANEGSEERSLEEIEGDIAQIEALANMSPEIKEMPEYKNLVATAEKVKAAQAESEGDEDEDEDEDEEYEDEDAPAEENEDARDEDDVFGLGVKGGEVEELEFEVSEEMSSFIESHYGIEDPNTFFASVDGWRTASQEGAQVRNELDDLTDGLQSLPTELKAAIQAYANAEDYQAAFNSTGARLNFDEPYNNQDKEVIVQHYFKDRFDKLKTSLDSGDIDEIDYEERVELLYESGERLFNSDKKMVAERRAEIIEDQESFEEGFKESALSSVSKLKEKFPDFSKSDLSKVRQRLVDGDIDSLFYNEDGTYNETAAEMLAMSMFGSQVVKGLLEQAENKGVSKANEKLVGRGKKGIARRKSQRSPQEKEALDSVSHLNSQFKEDPYE